MNPKCPECGNEMEYYFIEGLTEYGLKMEPDEDGVYCERCEYRRDATEEEREAISAKQTSGEIDFSIIYDDGDDDECFPF